jgi:hypothetical protein
MKIDYFSNEYDHRFKLFHELMAKKIRDVLLVSTPYDAWIMEEDCRLSERIIHEYRGLNLSNPPRITWVSSAEAAFCALDRKKFDMVITMPRLVDIDAFVFGQKIKAKAPDLPVILLSHTALPRQEYIPRQPQAAAIDRIFVWSGNTDILVALIKTAEDRMNVGYDTEFGGIRVILFIEDSPVYISSLLPILYKNVVGQTLAIMGEGLNEEHRLLTLRARPKILVAENHEEAMAIYEKYKPYVLGVISDTRFPKTGNINDNAGIDLLSAIKADRWDIPLLLTSSDPLNAGKAAEIPALFVDKNSPSLHAEVHRFFLDHLGFGDFVFRQPDGQEIQRAANLRALEKLLPHIPNESIYMHAKNNDFSRWLFARTEIELAKKLRPAKADDYRDDIDHIRQFLRANISARRKRRQKGILVNFDADDFDLDTDFFKIGKGSLGGKARGLAFMASILQRNPALHDQFPDVAVTIPQTLVITTDGFDDFIESNGLKTLSKADISDEEIATRFLKARFPRWITENLAAYLSQITYPLAVRSSSLLEDAQFRAYAGLYSTYMIPNDCPDTHARLRHLIDAIKLVYASTYYQNPKTFSRRVGQRTEEEKMAVIIQQVVGENYSNFFYPAISGVAQSHNYYPFLKMKPEEGITTIAMGLGRAVMEGEKTLRFSPKYPQLLPQRSTVDDILNNSQRFFWALKMEQTCRPLGRNDVDVLQKLEVTDAINEIPMKLLASTYLPQEHRIRDTTAIDGHRIITFAQVLKYDLFPLAKLLNQFLKVGEDGLGCPVEIEFSVNLCQEKGCKPEFAFLQIRPMTARAELLTVDISQEEIENAFCYSQSALGNTLREDLTDIVFVKPDVFDPGRTREIAHQIGEMNAGLLQENRPYLLIGPGRWGSADPWLGIPVSWTDICGVGVMVESTSSKLNADPSQGSHFFHNITTLGINYITVSQGKNDFLDWRWLTRQPIVKASAFVAHVRLNAPFLLKVDGRKSRCVMLAA